MTRPRRSLYIANWKMNKTAEETVAYLDEMSGAMPSPLRSEMAIAPAFTSLQAAASRLAGTGIALAAQDLHWQRSGAFTGEISGPMLASLGVTYVLIGHSERRTLFGETDEKVALKTRAAWESGLIPVICLGESQVERDEGRTEVVIESQLRRALAAEDDPSRRPFVIAYEPVWAIGTGRTATAAQAAGAHGFLRSVLATIVGQETADGVRILYGGSVNLESIAGIAAREGIDGCLVGGASLAARPFLELVRLGEGAGAGGAGC